MSPGAEVEEALGTKRGRLASGQRADIVRIVEMSKPLETKPNKVHPPPPKNLRRKSTCVALYLACLGAIIIVPSTIAGPQ